MARGTNRLRALVGAAMNAVRKPAPGARPLDPGKILVIHELLLGDTLMLAPLLAALRWQYPRAEVFVAANPMYAELFSSPMAYGSCRIRSETLTSWRRSRRQRTAT